MHDPYITDVEDASIAACWPGIKFRTEPGGPYAEGRCREPLLPAAATSATSLSKWHTAITRITVGKPDAQYNVSVEVEFCDRSRSIHERVTSDAHRFSEAFRRRLVVRADPFRFSVHRVRPETPDGDITRNSSLRQTILFSHYSPPQAEAEKLKGKAGADMSLRGFDMEGTHQYLGST